MKDNDEITEEEIKRGIEAFEQFCDQFGETDIYKQIFLEELFKILTSMKDN